MADEAQAFRGIGGNGSQGESLSSSGDRRSQIQKRIAGLAGNRGLEAFSAQPLFQSIRTGRPVGDLNHFSFYRDLHDSTFLLASELIRKQ